MKGLTPDEVAIIDALGEVANQISKLPVQHPLDLPETVRDIHDLQNRIMARVAVRAHPRLFPFRQEPRQL